MDESSCCSKFAKLQENQDSNFDFCSIMMIIGIRPKILDADQGCRILRNKRRFEALSKQKNPSSAPIMPAVWSLCFRKNVFIFNIASRTCSRSV